MANEAQAAKRPNIVYVDEHADARNDFLTDAFQSGLFGDIHVLPPEPALADMVERLLELKVDALVSDFQLSEAGPVGYNGEALVEAVLSKRAGFPCFIQTSFDDAALKAADDVNRVYSKNPKAEAGGRAQFLQRIVLQIERHQTRLAEWRDELQALLATDRSKLSATEIERIVELDEFVESNIGVDQSLSKQAKRDILTGENLASRQIALIDETEKLIADMRRALDE